MLSRPQDTTTKFVVSQCGINKQELPAMQISIQMHKTFYIYCFLAAKAALHVTLYIVGPVVSLSFSQVSAIV